MVQVQVQVQVQVEVQVEETLIYFSKSLIIIKIASTSTNDKHLFPRLETIAKNSLCVN